MSTAKHLIPAEKNDPTVSLQSSHENPAFAEVAVTFFFNHSATEKEEEHLTLTDLADLMRDVSKRSKDRLPLLKLARFGNLRSKNNSLRHNENVIAITGIEADYDGETNSFDDACSILRRAQISAIVYTTPSHTPEKPRWRVCCPFSQELPPGERDKMLGRLLGVFQVCEYPADSFDRCSWNLSQAYYFGSVASGGETNPDYQVVVIKGIPIDLHPELVQSTILRPRHPTDTTTKRGSHTATITDIEAALALIPNNNLDWDNWNRLGMATWYASGGSDEGYEVFDAWSQKSQKYTQKGTWERWKGFYRSPPERIGFGTLVYEAQKIDPDWTPGRALDLPQIHVEQGRRHEAADAGIAALAKGSPAIYRRGIQIVQVMRTPAKAADGRTVLVPGIVQVPQSLLARELGKAAVWLKYDRRSKKDLWIDPPDSVVSQIMGMVNEWPFEPIFGVISTPTLRRDGSILDQPGYDKETGLVLFDPPSMPPIPEKPTKNDALDALDLLDELLIEFPFAGDKEASWSVALSMLITPVLRGAIGPAVPLHSVKAPAGGTGKSYLADLAAAIATGERCPVLTYSSSVEETEKRLNGTALSGQSLISIDNCNGELRGQFLCQLVERPLLQIRALGSSDLIRIDNTFTCFANGNNIEIAEDLVRRTIQCSLDANMERPEARTFKRNPLRLVLADRGKYVAAVLTIARAYISAGMPNKPPTFMSFDGWSNLVRGSLMWLGCADPYETVADLSVADPIRQLRAEIFFALACSTEMLGREERVADIIKRAGENEELRNTLLLVAPGTEGKNISAEKLGRWLKNAEDRIGGGYKLLSDRSDKKRPKWRLAALK
ncbi:MAG: PriCT-2 domain-containing protein [Terriglobia bacterium]